MFETLAVPPGVTPRSASELLAVDCRRLNADCPALRVRVCEEGEAKPAGWVAARDLADRMDELIAGEARRIRAAHGCAVPPHVSAARLLHHYLWSVCLLAVGPWYLERRVPVLGADQVWIAPHSGELAFRPGGFACLPGDPAVRGPGPVPVGVRVVPGGSELRAELRAAVAEHAEPVLAAFRPVAKRGSRALWGMVTDDLVSALWYLGRELGREEDAVARAEEVLPGGTAPMVGSADFRRLTGSGGAEHLTRTRLGCCLYYVVRPEDTCITCPRTGDEERVRRLET
ncbi:iron-sulfur protein [Kitasatospora sp. NPDC008050]|uniref:iron-sulfur protein n=1 Tax=Kitasatospora sp. NPDC008050 TaxID=3364021 RepID=UPI0036E7A58D